MFHLTLRSASRELMLAALVVLGAASMPTSAAWAQEPSGGTPPPQGDQDPSPAYPSTKPTDVTIALVDYNGDMEFRPGSRLVANDASGPCHFEVGMLPTQASELASTGRTTMRVPTLCWSLMLVYFDEANTIDPASARTAKTLTTTRAVREFTFPLWLDADSTTYYSPSLKPIHFGDPAPSDSAPSTDQPSLPVNSESGGGSWIPEVLVSAGALLLLVLGAAAFGVRRRRLRYE
jgi:MYXO-CTERM domain-containing protein